jgi:hypothetical protein
MSPRKEEPRLRREQVELLDRNEVLTSVKGRREKGKLKRLADEARKRGYEPDDSPGQVLGYRERFEAVDEQRPPRGEQGQAVRETEFELVLQTFKKKNSRDQAAVGTATIRAGNNVEEYPILLEAPEGDFNQYNEFTVEGDSVVETESWWTAVLGCMRSRCLSVCAGALVSCSGTWIAYVLCVLAACGGCGVTCAACATCNCRWWCRWATGCCSQ